jgi:Glycosyltransferase family 87
MTATQSTLVLRMRGLAATPLWRVLSVVLFGVIPIATVIAVFWSAAADDAIAFDFRPFHRAAEAILRGDTPYPGPNDSLTAAAGPYVYPPLPAILAVPLSLLPLDVAGVVVMAALVGAALATLWVLGVRDWRCYGIALVWPPVISAIQTGNVTLWLALLAALVWRSRDRVLWSGTLVGFTLAVKLFFWPLVVWFAATRRLAAASVALGSGALLIVASWSVIGFAGFRSYPDLLQRLQDTVGGDSYTAYIVGLDAGLPSPLARAVWLTVGVAVLAASVIAARRHDELTSFVLAIVAALALTPIVWLHYFALLLVVVALAQPRLGLAWFVPLAFVVTPGSGQPSPFETATTLLVATATVAVAVRSARGQADSTAPERAHLYELDAVVPQAGS